VGDALAKGASSRPRPAHRQQGYFRAHRADQRVARGADHERGAVRAGGVIGSFETFDEMVTEANRLPMDSRPMRIRARKKTAAALGNAIETGMISINHHGLALPEVPFGGVKDSGYGTEGGATRCRPI